MPRIAAAAASFREKTEDRALVLSAGEHHVVCLADGSGGASGAAKAAEMFVSGVRRAVEARDIDLVDAAGWPRLIADLDQEIARDPIAGETTGIVLAVTATAIVGASVGDSRAWLFSATSSELTGQQARKPRLGTGRALAAPFTAPARGVLVVATDGLWDYANVDDVRAIACNPADDAAAALVRHLRSRSRTLADDVAIVVALLDEPDVLY